MMGDPCGCGQPVHPKAAQFCWEQDCMAYICDGCYNAESHAEHRRLNAERMKRVEGQDGKGQGRLI